MNIEQTKLLMMLFIATVITAALFWIPL